MSSPPPGSGLCTQVLSARPRAQRRVQQQTTAEIEVSRARHKSVVLWQHAADVIEPTNQPIPITRDLQPDEKQKSTQIIQNQPTNQPIPITRDLQPDEKHKSTQIIQNQPIKQPITRRFTQQQKTRIYNAQKNTGLQKENSEKNNPIQP